MSVAEISESTNSQGCPHTFGRAVTYEPQRTSEAEYDPNSDESNEESSRSEPEFTNENHSARSLSL